MGICAVVPVKPFDEGKTRLSSVLSKDERSNLNLNLFINTLQVLYEVAQITKVIVTSRDPFALSIADRYGATALKEEGSTLNQALENATKVALQETISRILIIPTDLPLLSASDLKLFISLSPTEKGIGIAPDRRCEGTNLLLTTPPGVILYKFGANSFNRHIEQAVGKGLAVGTIHLPNLGLDLDLPEDLEFLKTSVCLTKAWNSSIINITHSS
ncbi:MAG: 2-phospho-L-lactate guanylyltransferase [Anaerolineae bacterium]|nr:2-phospho-L-lactate guanylyltransferase [Anaerolineae bacterium]